MVQENLLNRFERSVPRCSGKFGNVVKVRICNSRRFVLCGTLVHTFQYGSGGAQVLVKKWILDGSRVNIFRLKIQFNRSNASRCREWADAVWTSDNSAIVNGREFCKERRANEATSASESRSKISSESSRGESAASCLNTGSKLESVIERELGRSLRCGEDGNRCKRDRKGDDLFHCGTFTYVVATTLNQTPASHGSGSTLFGTLVRASFPA